MLSSQIEFIRWIHEIGSPSLDGFFRLLNYLDSFGFWLFLIPIIWIFRGWRDGVRLFYLAMASSLTNMTLKSIFALPRPYHVDPSVGLVEVKGYSFPSGAAQTAVILSGLLIYYWKSPWKWAVGITYGLLLSFSRIYLGVHYPTDILAGWVVGLVLLWLFISARPKLEAFLETQPLSALWMLSQAVPLAIIPLVGERSAFQLCVISMGIASGIILLKKREILSVVVRGMGFKIATSCILVGTVFLFYAITSFPAPAPLLYRFFRVFSIGIWLPIGAYLLTRLANRIRGHFYG